jgi:hypothetical protein
MAGEIFSKTPLLHGNALRQFCLSLTLALHFCGSFSFSLAGAFKFKLLRSGSGSFCLTLALHFYRCGSLALRCQFNLALPFLFSPLRCGSLALRF